MDELIIFLVCSALFVLSVMPIAILVLTVKIRNQQRRFESEFSVIKVALKTANEELTKLGRSSAQENLATEQVATEPTVETAAEPAAQKSKPAISALAVLKAEQRAAERKAPQPSIEKIITPTTKPITPKKVSPPPPPLPAAQPMAARNETKKPANEIETAALKVIRSIWNWLIVGEEHRPSGVSMEYAIASQWLLRLGIVIFVSGIGFFLRYSIVQGWIPPSGRVALSMVTGIAMIVGGVRILGDKYRTLGQGLIGGGIATLYFSIFAAWRFYGLIDVFPAFALMALITAAAAALAIRLNSMLVAILGIIGGYGTPIALGSASTLIGLYGYLLVLGVGTVAIALHKKWHLLNYLAFVGTYALFFTTQHEQYEPTAFWQVFPFLTMFFVLFSTASFAYHLRHKEKTSLLELAALWINAGIFLATGHHMITEIYATHWASLLTLAVAAFYIGHVYYCLMRKIQDKALFLSFVTLASFFLTMTMPLIFSDAWITVSWSLQALCMLWMAGKLNSQFLRQLSFLIYGLVVCRFCVFDLAAHYDTATSARDLPISQYLLTLVERLCIFGTPIATLAAGYKLLTSSNNADDAQTPDVPALLSARVAMSGVSAIAFAMLLAYGLFEVNRSIGYFYEPLRMPALTIVCLLGAILLLKVATSFTSRAAYWAALSLLAAIAVKVCFLDMNFWSLSSNFLYSGSYSLRDGGLRMLDFGLTIAVLTWGALLIRGRDLPAGVKVGAVLRVMATGLFFLFSSAEINTVTYHFAPGVQAGAVSILWSLFALSFISIGIKHGHKWLRYAGLLLFAVVAWKIFFVDLQQLGQLYRIAAFIVLGIVILAGSFIYLKFRQNFSIPDDDDNNGSTAPISNIPKEASV